MAQIYKNGLVIQVRDNNISAFMEVKNVEVDGDKDIIAELPAGISKINITDKGAAGTPVVAETLPEPKKEYEGLIYFVGTEYYLCVLSDPEIPVYAWKHLVLNVLPLYLQDSDGLFLLDSEGNYLLSL